MFWKSLKKNSLHKKYPKGSKRSILGIWQSILNYLEVNPGFFTYRFGIEEGLAVKQALLELVRMGTWVTQSGYALSINPIRRYRNSATNARIIEQGGCYPHSMWSKDNNSIEFVQNLK